LCESASLKDPRNPFREFSSSNRVLNQFFGRNQLFGHFCKQSNKNSHISLQKHLSGATELLIDAIMWLDDR
jgi:hypothetical protein